MMTYAQTAYLDGFETADCSMMYDGTGLGLGMMAGAGGLGLIIWLIFWILLVSAVVYIIGHLIRSVRIGGFGKKSALDILEERYVKGEINREEYEQKKKDLS